MADKALRGVVLEGVGLLLEPIIRLVLKCGLTFPEFASVTREKFVQVATADFGIRGRPTNASRVAMLTGLDRRTVRRLRAARTEASPGDNGFMSRPSQVLDGWFHDPEFLDPSGSPRDLLREGDTTSFEVLSRRYAPGIPPVAMIKELIAAGCVQAVDDKRLRVLKRAFIPRQLSETQVRLWASVVRDVSAAIEHNLTRKGRESPLFERRALNLSVRRDAVPAFEAFLEAEGQALLERIDDWLAANQVDSPDTDDRDVVRLGAGLYQIFEHRVPLKNKAKTPRAAAPA